MTSTILDEVVRLIVEEVGPEKIVLIGSHARGEARPDSDLDLIVIEKEPFGPDHDRWTAITRIGRALRPVRVPKDILVYSREEEDRWRGTINHVLAWGLREGRVLYERA